jgi:hypothetical protein
MVPSNPIAPDRPGARLTAVMTNPLSQEEVIHVEFMIRILSTH